MSNSYLIPIGNKLVVEKNAVEKHSPGGLFLPNGKDTDGLSTGKVLATGPGRYTIYGNRIPLEVAVGDSVLFNSHSGCAYKDTAFPEKQFVILTEDDVLTVVRNA